MPSNSKKTLIVEDNPHFMREMVRAVELLREGGEVFNCRTGGEALATLERSAARVDLALVDLGLPDISGIDVIRALHRQLPEVPILVISVASSEESVLEAIRAGARGYLLKGDSGAEMASAIDEVLRGNYPISPALARSLFRLACGPTVGTIEPGLNLTQRELETLWLLARGNTYKEVASTMNVALSTVQSNIRNLYRKLQVHSQMQAVAKARSVGLL